MQRLLCVVVATLSVIGGIECGVTPTAGKCRPISCETIPIDFEKLAGLGKWEIKYATNAGIYQHADQELRDATPVADGVFRVDDRRKFDDNSTNDYTFTVSYVDNVVIEDTVEDGVRHQFRIIPLALSRENGLLYYRCSDAGVPGLDTRIIVVPRENVLSEEGAQYLLSVDKSCNFTGHLRELPKRIS